MTLYQKQATSISFVFIILLCDTSLAQLRNGRLFGSDGIVASLGAGLRNSAGRLPSLPDLKPSTSTVLPLTKPVIIDDPLMEANVKAEPPADSMLVHVEGEEEEYIVLPKIERQAFKPSTAAEDISLDPETSPDPALPDDVRPGQPGMQLQGSVNRTPVAHTDSYADDEPLNVGEERKQSQVAGPFEIHRDEEEEATGGDGNANDNDNANGLSESELTTTEEGEAAEIANGVGVDEQPEGEHKEKGSSGEEAASELGESSNSEGNYTVTDNQEPLEQAQQGSEEPEKSVETEAPAEDEPFVNTTQECNEEEGCEVTATGDAPLPPLIIDEEGAAPSRHEREGINHDADESFPQIADHVEVSEARETDISKAKDGTENDEVDGAEKDISRGAHENEEGAIASAEGLQKPDDEIVPADSILVVAGLDTKDIAETTEAEELRRSEAKAESKTAVDVELREEEALEKELVGRPADESEREEPLQLPSVDGKWIVPSGPENEPVPITVWIEAYPDQENIHQLFLQVVNRIAFILEKVEEGKWRCVGGISTGMSVPSLVATLEDMMKSFFLGVTNIEILPGEGVGPDVLKLHTTPGIIGGLSQDGEAPRSILVLQRKSHHGVTTDDDLIMQATDGSNGVNVGLLESLFLTEGMHFA